MRILRLALLINYFSKNKNKLKAIRIINIGIFLSLFALSTAGISFFIENKINNQQFIIIEQQQSKRELGKIITSTEDVLNRFDNKLRQLKNHINDKSYLVESELYNKIIHLSEFISPYVFYTIHDLEITEREMKAFVDSYEEFLNLLMPELEAFYVNDNEEIVYLKEKMGEFKIEINYLSNLNKKKYYKSIFNPDYKEIYNQVQNPLSYQIYFNEIYEGLSWDNLPEDYLVSYDYHRSSVIFYSALIDYFRGSINTSELNIKEAERLIINYSKLEKNLILLTFVFQFLTFLIIQIFELGSINQNKKSKLL